MGNNRNRRVVYDCDYCGKQSSERPSHYIKSIKHFCSIKCRADYVRNVLPKEQQPRYGSGLPEDERNLRKWCRSTLNHALRDGLITKKICEVCGRKAQAHHDDYKKPFDVIWLCFYHHRKLKHNQNPIYENPELLT